MESSLLSWKLFEKQKELETSYQTLFRLPNVFRNFLSLVIQDLTNVHALIEGGFEVIPKLQLAIYANHFIKS